MNERIHDTVDSFAAAPLPPLSFLSLSSLPTTSFSLWKQFVVFVVGVIGGRRRFWFLYSSIPFYSHEETLYLFIRTVFKSRSSNREPAPIDSRITRDLTISFFSHSITCQCSCSATVVVLVVATTTTTTTVAAHPLAPHPCLFHSRKRQDRSETTSSSSCLRRHFLYHPLCCKRLSAARTRWFRFQLPYRRPNERE